MRDNVAIFLVNLSLGSYNLDTFAARTSAWLHNVHVLIVGAFSFHAELSVILRENVSLGAEIKLLCSIEHLLRPLQVLPH